MDMKSYKCLPSFSMRYGNPTHEINNSDVKVIYLDPLNRGDYEMDSYLKGMHRNLELIQSAFAN